MKFSVLISLYYKENPDFLRQSLDSVFNQTLPPSEVILVEDGPLTTELYSVVSEYEHRYPTLHIIKLPQNGGLGKALNEGLKHCNFDLVVRMDTDDICFPDRFMKQVNFMVNHPEIGICSAWVEEFKDDINNVVSIRRIPEKSEELYEYGKKRCPINHPAAIFRKSVVLSCGGYRHFKMIEDYYLWVQMMVKGVMFWNIQECLLHFRTTDDMYKRRGGWNLAINEFKLQYIMYKTKYISFFSFIINAIPKFIIRIAPNPVRKLIYENLLR